MKIVLRKFCFLLCCISAIVAAPFSVNAAVWEDHFDGTRLDAKWTAFPTGASSTADVANGYVHFYTDAPTDTGTTQMALLQLSQSVSFPVTIETRVVFRQGGYLSSYNGKAGILICLGNSTFTTGPTGVAIQQRANGYITVYCMDEGAFTAGGSDVLTGGNAAFLRVVIDADGTATTWYKLYPTDEYTQIVPATCTYTSFSGYDTIDIIVSGDGKDTDASASDSYVDYIRVVSNDKELPRDLCSALPPIFDEYTVGPTGDYTTLGAAFTATASDLTSSLKGAVFTLQPGSHSATTADLNLGSWTTTSIFNVVVRGSESHDGYYNGGSVTAGGSILNVTGAIDMSSDAESITFSDLKVHATNRAFMLENGGDSGDVVVFSNVVAYCDTNQALYCSSVDPRVIAYNSSFISADSWGLYVNETGPEQFFMNCSFLKATGPAGSILAYDPTADAIQFFNCIGEPASASTGASYNNCVKAADITVANFVAPASTDFNFTPVECGDAWYTGAVGYMYPEQDVLGTTRSTSGFDIGAFYVSAGDTSNCSADEKKGPLGYVVKTPVKNITKSPIAAGILE